MTYDNFTINAQEAILKAQQLAGSLGQQGVDTPHLLKGIIETDESLTDFLFQKIGINMPLLKREINKALETYPKVSGGNDKQFLTDSANKALANARKMMPEFGDEFISLELILLGILKGNDKGSQILKDLGATEDNLKKAIIELRNGRKVTEQTAENQYNALKKYGVDLIEKAKQGKLDPIIGRDEEIRRIL
nr:Clp protease N-terminal domain-containing protein [Saprospiraceae bacterium]